MNENKIVELPVKNKAVEETSIENKKSEVYSNTSNPIYKKMLEFHHAKIGEKLSIKDILR